MTVQNNSSKRVIERFRNSSRGNISAAAALAFIPFLMMTSAAVDMSNAVRMKAELQAAADAGVLASATALASGESDTDKKALANKAFYANLSPKLLASLTATPQTTIDFPAKSVYMKVQVQTKQVLTKFFANTMKLGVEAEAVVDKGKPICMMSFNKTADKAMYFQGTADIMASGCSVHANSSSNIGLDQDGTGKATAESFCVFGGYDGADGSYSPKPDDNCRQEEDPLKDYFATAVAATDTTSCISPNPTPVKSDMTLSPGVYCGGLKIQGATVELNPGTYVIRDGALNVTAGSTLKGEKVTILLTGNQTTYFDNQGGANVNLSAPTTGLFAGIVIAQTPDSIPSPHENTITGGGSMDLSGIVYFPTQPLLVTGNGDIGDTTSQFAIMADTINVEGTGSLTVHMSSDYEAAGYPSLPTAHDKVRLAF